MIPEIEFPGPNRTTVSIPALGILIHFSYRTCVAFAVNGKRTVRVNEWGNTTAQHLCAIDGGSTAARAARLPGDEFQQRLAALWAEKDSAANVR